MPIEISQPDGTLDVDAANRALDEYEAANPPAESDEDRKDKGADNAQAGEGADDSKQTTTDADDATGEGEEAVGENADEDWMLHDDIRELADSLGVSQEELRDFSGPEELERAARILDRNLMEVGQRIKPGEEQDAALVAAEAARAKAEAQERAAARERGDDGKFVKAEEEGYKPEITAEYFDEQIVGEFDRLGKHYGERVRQLEQQLEALSGQLRQDAERREIDSFDAIVDGMGHEDLFGQSADLDGKTKDNRAKLWEAVDTLRAGLASRGKQGGLTPTLVRRALNLEFADQLSHQQRRSYSQRLQQQAQRKLGAGGHREATGTKRSWKGSPEKDPVLHEAWRELERESG